MNIINNLDVFIELIPDLVFFKDVNGVHTHCNAQFRKDDESILRDESKKTF